VQDHESNARMKQIKCRDKTGAGELNSHGEVMWVTRQMEVVDNAGGQVEGGFGGPPAL
jgi:hypothetical protein